MNCSTWRPLLSICLVACAVGCHKGVEATPEAAVATQTPEPTPPPDANATSKAANEPELAEPKEATPPIAEFTPPFPERLELFEAPKRAQSNIRRDDEHGETVELKGFINVDQPKAILSIDGNMSLVAEGGEKYGVRVISIQPPSVVLQRGRNRWTAKLE